MSVVIVMKTKTYIYLTSLVNVLQSSKNDSINYFVLVLGPLLCITNTLKGLAHDGRGHHGAQPSGDNRRPCSRSVPSCAPTDTSAAIATPSAIKPARTPLLIVWTSPSQNASLLLSQHALPTHTTATAAHHRAELNGQH